MIVKPLNNLPPLAWLVEVDSVPRVVCGRDVEVGPSFLVEGCWDGPFAAARFDAAENFFGSGFRISPDGTLIFATATHTIECLYALLGDERPIVSNSLPLLLAYADVKLDPGQNYCERLAAVTRGVSDYDRNIAWTNKGRLLRIAHANFVISPDGIHEQPKSPCTAFENADAYCAYLSRSLSACFQNARDASRRRRYTPLASCSTGYDSNTVAALAVRLGCDRAVSLTVSRGGEPDSGVAVARCLGLDCVERSRPEHGTAPNSEIEFLGSGAGGGGDYVLGEFEDELRSSVFLTGYYGGAVWEKNLRPSADMARKDDSGCSLTEFRLRVGFFHVPVPFIGCTRAEDIWRISNSDELREYSIGGTYDRPICRSVLERAGVPRTLFGMQKKAVTIGFVWTQKCLHPASRTAFNQFIRERGFATRLLLERVLYRIGGYGWRLLTKVERLDQQLLGGRLGAIHRRGAQWLREWLRRFQDGTTLYANLLFLWALESAVQERKQVLADAIAAPFRPVSGDGTAVRRHAGHSINSQRA